MPDETKPRRAPFAVVAALAVGALGGAFGQRAASAPSHAKAARPVALRFLADGQIALGMEVGAGCTVGSDSCVARIGRELVWNAKGGAPRLNGEPISDPAALKLGAAAATFAGAAVTEVGALTDRLAR